MNWSIEWSRNALYELNKIEYKDAERIMRKLETASADPHRYFLRLKNSDYYKLRVCDFRIIALLFPSNKSIIIINLGHRKNIYK